MNQSNQSKLDKLEQKKKDILSEVLNGSCKDLSVVKKPALSSKRVFLYDSRVNLLDYDPYQINQEVYELINSWIKSRKIKNKYLEGFINSIYPERPNLYEHYVKFSKLYPKLIKQQEAQKRLDQLNEMRDNMEEFNKFGLSLRKKRKKTENNPYQKYFDFLDSNIELIENVIYLGVSPKNIVAKLVSKCHGLTPIIFERWSEETKYIDRIIFAYRASANEQMHSAQEFMMEWLNKPDLGIQHVGLVREIGLFRSRMAEFMDRKKYGKKVEIVDERPQTKVIAGKDLREFLEGISNISGSMNNEINSEIEEIQSEESEDLDEPNEYTDFEEV